MGEADLTGSTGIRNANVTDCGYRATPAVLH